jgi:UTP pyrophosphatase
MTKSPERYIQHYPEHVRERVQLMQMRGELGQYLTNRYVMTTHTIQTDRMLYDYTMSLKHTYLRQSPILHKVCFDAQLDTVQHALGVNMAISKIHGARLKAHKEIRIARLFQQAPEAFLEMIVIHELAHLRERNHDKAFYRLCQHMLPDYHQREFDVRIWLMLQEFTNQSSI